MNGNFQRTTAIDDEDTRWIGVLGLGIATVGLGVSAGVVGVLTGIALGVLWYRLPPVYIFAIGHTALLIVFPDRLAVAPLAPIELGLLVVLGESMASTRTPRRVIVAFAATYLGTLTVMWAAIRATDGLWVSAAVIVGFVALLGYGLHRYELLRLGLVEGSP